MTPTASLTTAADAAREFFRIDPDAALTPTVERCVADLAAFLTTYAAQVRRDTMEECALIAEKYDRRHPMASGTIIAESICASFIGKEIRALPPGSPSSQTDTGDK